MPLTSQSRESNRPPRSDSARRIFGTGEMADLTRAFDWAASPLGPVDTWPDTLLTCVNLLLASRHPMFLWWGPDHIQFYNDAYRPSLGKGKHPTALGQPGRECWKEIWDEYIEARIELVYRQGRPTWYENQVVPILRNGKLEEVYWTWSDSPVRDADGNIVGVFVTCSETTDRVLAERELQRSRESLQLALEAADLGTWSYNPHDKTFTADAKMQRIFGAPAPTGDIDFWQQILHPEDRLAARDAFASALAGGRPYNVEYRVLHPDGIRWIRSKGKLLIAEDGTTGMFAIVEDITESKLAQIELHNRARDLRESQRIGKMGSWHLDLATGHLTWSEEVYRLMERDPSEPVMNYAKEPEIIEPESGRRLQAAVDQCIATGQTYELDVKMFLHNGKTVWLATRGEPVFDATGKIVAIRGTVRDITDRKLTEEALRSSEQRLQLAIESARLGTWSYDAATDTSTGDAAMQRIFGSSRASGDFKYWVEFVHPDDRGTVGRDFSAAISGQATYESEYRILRPTDGEVRWIRSRGRTLSEPDAPLCMLVIVEDITDRKLAEQALTISEERLRLALSTTREMGTFDWQVQADHVYVDANYCRIAGLDPAIAGVGTPIAVFMNVMHPDDRPLVDAAIQESVRTGNDFAIEYRIVHSDGSLRSVAARGSCLLAADGTPIRFPGVIVDITDRKRADAALMQHEKLVAVGRLAASIAHEINNPLESVTNLLYLARNSDDVHQVQQYLSHADLELQRVANITTQTLRFHRQSTHPISVSCDDLLGSVIDVHRSRLNNSTIAVEKRKRAHRPVSCFDGEIRQVLGNLVGNAIDAMQPRGGRLLLRSREGHDRRPAAIGLAPRPGLILTIADTGPGISPATLARIFEPFFTTKGMAGTGLGLWISKEIVERHRGHLAVRSSQNPAHHGTVFTIFLPFEAATR